VSAAREAWKAAKDLYVQHPRVLGLGFISSIELEPLDDSWHIWSTQMEFALDRKGLWGAVSAKQITGVCRETQES
jgi:hypothetical protein